MQSVLLSCVIVGTQDVERISSCHCDLFTSIFFSSARDVKVGATIIVNARNIDIECLICLLLRFGANKLTFFKKGILF